MSNDAGSPDRPAVRYSGGQIAMLVIGGLLLLPGVCSLFFLIGMMGELMRGDPIAQALAGLWIICFFVSAAGVALIYLARRDARAAAASSPDETPP